MEAILDKYEIETKEDFFDGIITAAQINANEFAKQMIEELSSEEKQEFKAHFEHYIANDIDAIHEGETYEAFIDSIYIPNPNNKKLINTMKKKTAEQRQFEQVKDKLTSLQAEMENVLELMPTKGAYSNDCQKMALLTIAKDFEHHINGIELEDFTPNEYSGDFKLSYS
jgi:hypothetical protein